MNPAASIYSCFDHAAEAARAIAAVDALTTRHDAEHAGTRVRWRSAGRGSPLVLLHGGHGSWQHWIRNVEALAERHTVWVPDMPAYGESGALPDSAGLPHLVEVLAQTLDQLVGTGTPIGLTGFSFGGVCAVHLAARRGHVARLALLGPGGHGTPRRQSLPMVNWRMASGEEALVEDLRHNLRALMLHDDASIDALAVAVHRRACETTRFRSKAVSQGGHLKTLLDGMAMPILFAWGEHDVTAHPDRVGPWWVDGRPERQWRTVAGAGHWVQYEQAAATNALLLGFFG
ncbi:4,5:9,10-diseco-3-hydroxy-5,9, 17-trioxoandrosta-1(10),2-diene-4-oate hydrolase [Pigmentiphaga humi]|uniref:4,5:9,10-diseco-3-hydroxy-5,9, 17-trioxoandrosta-1(10),2-diene-4-oate hydrolase n=1 Tax=Pigmentiphaga humi TaxID=2478468 RepID=A0A3P4AWZ1_9BURK|nr:alpha/beta fold hydrolase [Pigmentiphaga humi]VCU68584.1 4,5:9,10-diseco-3-hydroxy-5,9, 17-trioxoandrosta-1(10),2-diene-4-oate hydrolase [Pigmentiphaga humi]